MTGTGAIGCIGLAAAGVGSAPADVHRRRVTAANTSNTARRNRVPLTRQLSRLAVRLPTTGRQNRSRPLVSRLSATCEEGVEVQGGGGDAGDDSPMVEHVRERLEAWVRASCSSEEGCSVETPFVTLEVLPLESDAGHITVGLSGVVNNGVRTAVVCLGVQRTSAEAVKLEGAVMHWACEKEPGGNWYPPPDGWRTDPDWSIDAGGGAWQTPLRPEKVAGHPRRAHCVLLQIPLLGPLERRTAGLPFVMRTADGRWLKNAATGTDFFVGLGRLQGAELPEGSQYVPPTHGDASESVEMDKPPPLDSADASVSVFGVQVELSMPPLPVARVRHAVDLQAIPERHAGGIEGDGDRVATWVVDLVTGSEEKAERSLMHRFQIAHTIMSRILEDGASEGMLVLAAWLRYSAARHLTWNRNYNVKPREISAAQDLLTKRCAEEILSRPDLWELLRIALVAIGRGGQGDVGQRIRDEILTVQSKNNAKGGMMEEWHQKLHNNTSPDDVVICEALLAYLRSGLDISAYWATLHAQGITRERLASFDRAIRSEPSFHQGQVPGLVEDLTNYLHTLKAVHCGDDLKSAAAAVLGYSQGGRKGRGISMAAIKGVATPELRDALIYVLQPSPSGDEPVDAIDALLARLDAVMEARRLLAPHMLPSTSVADRSRLRDVIFLDLALESAARAFVETSMDQLKATAGMTDLQRVWAVTTLILEGCCLSLGSNDELRMCLKECLAIRDSFAAGSSQDLNMRLQAAVERLKLHLSLRAQQTVGRLQPTAQCLGSRLGIGEEAQQLFSEEVIRAGPIAPASQLVAVLERLVREVTKSGPWQVVAPGPSRVTGQVVVVGHLKDVQDVTYSMPTLLLVRSMGGEEEIPSGVVGVITESATDVLCHAAIRARNGRVLMLSCFDPDKVKEISECEGMWASLEAQPGAPVQLHLGVPRPVSSADEEKKAILESTASSGVDVEDKAWTGKWAIPSSAFGPDVVGAKALNVEALRGKLPSWIGLPTSAAIPYGTFEEVLAKQPDSSAAHRIEAVAEAVAAGDASAVAPVRLAIKQLRPDGDVKRELEACFQGIGAVWQEEDWPAMWQCITEVWASQWNNRVVLAFGKAGLQHSRLRMSVLCQPLLPAKYAFVAHTANPLTGDSGEVYVEVVKGMGETLVGNYAGAALRATARKAATLPANLEDLLPATPESLLAGEAELGGLPSKSVYLTAPHGSIMFRSDSNCEDLDGFAGAGFFDSVPLHPPSEVFADYTEEPLVTDEAYRRKTLSGIAAASVAVEIALGGGAQDVEGVVLENGSIYVVQSRPQI